jgi:hypothetical protein
MVNKISIKMTQFWMELGKMFLKFTEKCKDPKISKELWKKNVGRLSLSYSYTNSKASGLDARAAERTVGK